VWSACIGNKAFILVVAEWAQILTIWATVAIFAEIARVSPSTRGLAMNSACIRHGAVGAVKTDVTGYLAIISFPSIETTFANIGVSASMGIAV